MWFSVILTGLFSFVVYYWLKFQRESRNGYAKIPGPSRLPIVGSLLSIGTKPYLTFTEFAKKYGSIFSVRMGSVELVVLNDIKTIKEAFSDLRFAGRAKAERFLMVHLFGKCGLITNESDNWSEQRRFAIRNLRDLGFGKQSMESLLIHEANMLVERLNVTNGEPTNLNRIIEVALFNSLWSIVTGRRYEFNDPKLAELMESFEETSKKIYRTGIALFFPEYSNLIVNLSTLFGGKTVKQAMVPFRQLFDEVVTEHEKTFVPGVSRDFIDAYLNEIEKTTDPKSSFHKDNSANNSCRGVVADFFFAGIDTTTQTLMFGILFLMTTPRVQKKLQDEIDRIIGDRSPEVSDKPLMPYAEAVTLEIFRKSSIVSLGVFHSALEDIVFNGHFIAKDTLVASNLYGAHHDEKIWGDPDIFRPERFLNDDETKIVKQEFVIPFSLGKRQCPAESLAKNQIFLFVTSIFQNFEITPDPNNLNPTWEPEIGFTLIPHHYKACCKPRKTGLQSKSQDDEGIKSG